MQAILVIFRRLKIFTNSFSLYIAPCIHSSFFRSKRLRFRSKRRRFDRKRRRYRSKRRRFDRRRRRFRRRWKRRRLRRFDRTGVFNRNGAVFDRNRRREELCIAKRRYSAATLQSSVNEGVDKITIRS